MAQDWKINIWGVRGSMPAASQDFLAYGGNTSCVSVDCVETLVVFDAGTGLSALGGTLQAGRPIHLFLGHIHIDHLLGLFNFKPFYDPGAEVHLYGEPRSEKTFRKMLETVIGPPYWPVGFADFQACVVFHEIGPDQTISLPGGQVVRTMRGCHPNLGLVYRLEADRKSVVYTLDCELTPQLRPDLTEFCRDTDVLVWDANFTSPDLALHPGWGHSCWQQGVEIGRGAGAKLILMSHYSQSYTDNFLREQERLADANNVRFAREGMEIHI